MRSEADVNRALEHYADTVRRICFVHLNNRSDVEDVFQEVFLKYLLHDGDFAGDDHKRAWLIRVSINACKDLLKSAQRKKDTPLTDREMAALPAGDLSNGDRELLDAVLRLPPKYRDVIYLHYYEGYKAAEIADILKKRENTVYTWLARARQSLKEQLGGEIE